MKKRIDYRILMVVEQGALMVLTAGVVLVVRKRVTE